MILDKVDFNIESGKVIGIIGKSGAGKTTFVNILSGLLRPTEGEILIKDINNNKLSFKSLIGYVPQTTFLMDTSIKENICFGNNIDNKKYDLVLEQSQLKNFINELKDGDSTIVGEKGIKISGGQRQRISIARALYNDSQLIIFDEPTSALDSKTQEDLINSLIELKGQKTIVLISHIKSFMEKCDEIYEISNSKIKRINE
jgi:ABC-type bacteriocin/lantibiotic exporter with double-glycine peptidase domain